MDQATTCIPLEPQPSSRRRLYFRMDNHFTNEILKTPTGSTTRMNDLLYCRASISVELAGEYLENAVNAMRSLSQGDPDYATAAESLQLITEAINANSKIRAITYRHRHLELSAEKEEQDFDPSTLVLCSRVKEENLSWTRMLWKIMQLTLHFSFCVFYFLWSLGEFSRVLMLLFACILLLQSPFYSLGLRILKYILQSKHIS